jgi:hypothetical protein
MKRITKIIVRNDSKKPKTLYLEPWGEDYRMMPNEEFEIIESEADEDFHFQININDDILVWAEGQNDAYPRVYVKGRRIIMRT